MTEPLATDNGPGPAATADALICVDVGNTTMAAGEFSAASSAGAAAWWRTPNFYSRWPSPTDVPWQRLPATPCRWVIATVNLQRSEALRHEVARRRPADQWQVLSSSAFPIETTVRDKQSVGADRLAAAVAANAIRDPKRAAIVVDAGSAINVEWIDADGVFRGGAILPGMAMSAAALAEGTALLPVVSPADAPPRPVGRDTNEAIRSGLYWGAWGAIQELVRQFSPPSGEPPHVFVTGGGVLWADLDQRFERAPHLVLSGIALAWSKTCAHDADAEA